MGRRIAILNGIPAPYREPVFAELASRPGVELEVLYCSRGHDDVGWSRSALPAANYRRVFLPNLTPRRLRRTTMLGYANLTLGRELDRFRPEYMIVYGTNQLTYWLAFAHAIRRHIPFALRSDSNIRLDTSQTWRSRLRRQLLRRLLSHAHGVLTVGSANREYWLRHGARLEQIFSAPYAVAAPVEAMRARAPSPPPIRLLYVGRLVPNKGVDLLLEAFNDLVGANPIELTIVGTGPEQERLLALQSEAARRATHWLGQLDNERVRSLYAEHHVFVLPSRREPWGLVVNEAMAAGLPVVAHVDVGSAIDLIEPGRTGWLYTERTAPSLRAALVQAIESPDRAAIGDRAQAKVRAWSIAAEVNGFLSAVDAAAKVTPATPRARRAG